MPVEIRELIIKTEIESSENNNSGVRSRRNSCSEPNPGSSNEIIRKIQNQLSRQKER